MPAYTLPLQAKWSSSLLKRDRVLLSLLLSGGLRGEKLATLTIAHAQRRDNYCSWSPWKGQRVRTVSISTVDQFQFPKAAPVRVLD